MRPNSALAAAMAAFVILLGCGGVAGSLIKTNEGGNDGSTGTTAGTTSTTAGSSASTSGGTTDTTSGGTTTSTSGGTTSGGTGGATVDVSLEFMSFTPQEVNAHAGDTIRWTNTSILAHTVTSDTSQAGLSSPTIAGPGGTFTWPVPADAAIGTHYFYHCSFHGFQGDGTSFGTGMAGEITVN